jgi:hypothetical protein
MKNDFGISVSFIYFCMGMIVGFMGSVIGLTLLRPMLPLQETWVKSLVVLPFIFGIGLGRRVARLGKQHHLPLFKAILCALGKSPT